MEVEVGANLSEGAAPIIADDFSAPCVGRGHAFDGKVGEAVSVNVERSRLDVKRIRIVAKITGLRSVDSVLHFTGRVADAERTGGKRLTVLTSDEYSAGSGRGTDRNKICQSVPIEIPWDEIALIPSFD